MINKDFTTGTLQKLVQINSVNPALQEGGGGEAEIGKFIAQLLQGLNIEVIVDQLAPGRMNVTGVIKGTGSGRSLILNAHMDTVGVAGMQEPFSGRVADGKLYGRGAYDMKGSIAAILAAAKAIRDEKLQLHGDLILSFVADEEYESIGAQAFVTKYNATAAIVTEPTNLHVCLAHRGFGIYKITTTGRTAHGGNHHIGIDANLNMGLLLAELHAFSKTLPAQRKHPLCGEASMHVPLIKGGRSLFVYSHACEVMVERRTLPGETEVEVTAEFQALIDRVNRKEPACKAELETVLWRSPYEVASTAPVVNELIAAGNEVKGFEQDFIGHTWWEDSALFGDAGIETVIIGPKGGGIHEDVEWVELDSVAALAEILLQTSIRYCGMKA